MDPDEGGGTATPPSTRRSRRQQNLDPIPRFNPTNHANDNNSNTSHSGMVEDASASQYHPHYHPTVHQQSHPSSTGLSYAPSRQPSPPAPSNHHDDDASTIQSVHNSHRLSRSSDPPEETCQINSSNQRASSQHRGYSRASSNAPTSYRSASPYELPDTIQLHALNAPSSITQPSTYVTSETYQALQDTVFQLRHDFQNFQVSNTQQNNNIQHEMNLINDRMTQQQETMQHTVTNAVTNAVLAAMTQFQSPAHPILPSPSQQHATPSITTTMSSVTVPTSHTTHSPDPLTSTHMPAMHTPSHVPIAPSPHPPLTSPIPHLPEQGTADNPVTLADLVQMSSSPKCSFPIYTKNQNIFEWKTACLLELTGSSKPSHRRMVLVNADGNMQFQTDLSIQDKQELFRMTKKALSTKLNINFITVDVINRADGLQLWDMIIKEFQPFPKDEMELEDMKQDFLRLSKATAESDQTYLERFQSVIKSMEHYHVAPSDYQQVIVFLKGLKDSRLTQPILELRTKHQASIYSDWIQSGNLRHTLERARNYCTLVNQYTPVIRNSHTRPSITPSPGSYANSVRTPSNSTTRPPHRVDPPGPGSSPMNAPNLEQLKQQFKTELLSAGRKQDCIFEWRNKQRKGCIFHPTQNHKFLKCRMTELICQECHLENELTTAIFNSQQSTRRLLAERGVDPNPYSPHTREVQPPTQARRVTTPVTPTHLTSSYEPSPPTPPRAHDDVESVNSHSSLISTNNGVDPYLYHNKYLPKPLSNSPKSILFPPKSSNKKVTFDALPTNMTIKHSKLELKEIPSNPDPAVAIPDSGATHDMTSNKQLFEYLVTLQTPLHATLGDNTTQLPIIAYGMMNYFLHNKRIRRMGYYIPTLGTTLLSIKQHIKYTGCYFHAESNEVTLAFPDTLLDADTTSEFTIPIKPAKDSSQSYTFDESEAILSSSTPRRKYTVINKNIAKYLDCDDYNKFTSTVRIKKLIPEAKLPRRATAGSVGFDLHSTHGVTIAPNSTQVIHTGLAMQIPKPMYLRLASRSSFAAKGINVQGGVIDNDFRGEIKILLHNSTSNPFVIHTNERIAQGIFEVCHTPCMMVVDSLPPTHRGHKGFGSTNTIEKQKIFINRIKAKMSALHNSNAKQNLKLHQIDNAPNTPEDAYLQSTIEPVTSIHKHPPSSSPNPSILPENKVNHSLPKSVRFSKDFLAQATGFYNNDNISKYLPILGNDTVTISHKNGMQLSDEGNHSTMRSRRRNTTKSPTTSLAYSDCWHMDIGFGPTSAIGGVRYCLLLIDKATRLRRVYPLKNLTNSLHRALKQFLTDVGITPKLIRTDFDKKLLGQTAKDILQAKKIRVEGAPPHRQHQNGLVERAWQSAVVMARNWLKSSLLPSTFWYFALKRATEISNISPVKLNQKITTPFTAAHQSKVDYRQLFPMFSIAYIKQMSEIGGMHKNKWSTQSLKTICVGTCPNSDSLLFYHPPTKSLLSCADNYHFDTFLPAGPQFDEKFDGRFQFTTKSANTNIHIAPTHEHNSPVFIKQNANEYHRAVILETPHDENKDPYTVQLMHSGDILQLMNDEIFDMNPTASDELSNGDTINQMIPWLKHDAKITIALPQFQQRPKQGFLQLSEGDGDWYFIPGRGKIHDPIHLPDFHEKALSMAYNKKIMPGWINATTMTAARNVRITSNIIAHHITAKHVSAASLVNSEAPISLLKHSKLHPKDKMIWDRAYAEEYNGLVTLDTWEEISEEEATQLQKHKNAKILPTMTVSVIKKDKHGNPIRAKYCIVALGNLDPFSWEKHDCFAPVLSQHDLRLLINHAVHLQCIPKSGDVSQAFCQSFLPEDELYICKAPPGCPYTSKSAYWKLRKTLYGLKRSPRHWYEKAHDILTKIGLTRCPNSPCLYSGTFIPGQPPIYLGLYVDDFVFFSQSPKVETYFQDQFATHVTKVTFTDEIDFFLGIKFDCTRHDDNTVTIHLSQQAFIENLLYTYDMHHDHINAVKSPYRSGYPIDSIPNEAYDDETQSKYTKQLQSIVGSLTWLSMSTRPDLATITNILAKYVKNPSKGHIDAAKRILRYLKGSHSKGITFSTSDQSHIESFLKFPIAHTPITALCDANWGPQDQSKPLSSRHYPDLELFKSRSISGFIIIGHGPIHWMSKRQSLTARSSAEAEIVATDNCTKHLLYLRNIAMDLGIDTILFPSSTTLYNDNAACVKWSKNMTTKGLRYIQIRENAVRESVLSKFITVKHIAGKLNLADLFTKEDRDCTHFMTIRDLLVQDVPTHLICIHDTSTVQGGCQPKPKGQVGTRQ